MPCPGTQTLASFQGSTYISDLWWTKWKWDRILSRYFGSLLSLSLRQCSTLVFIFVVLFSGGRPKEAGEPSYNATFFTKLGAWHRTVPLIFKVFIELLISNFDSCDVSLHRPRNCLTFPYVKFPSSLKYLQRRYRIQKLYFNPLNTELNPICQ